MSPAEFGGGGGGEYLGATLTIQYCPEQLECGLGCKLKTILFYLLFLFYTYFPFHFSLVRAYVRASVCLCVFLLGEAGRF